MLHPFQGGEQKPHSASTSSGSATVAAIYSGSSSPYRCRQRCTAVPVDNKSGLDRQCAGAGKPANEAKYVRRRRIADTACCTNLTFALPCHFRGAPRRKSIVYIVNFQKTPG